jgi:hypothetical protein
MTRQEFLAECNNRTVDVSLAFENEKIKDALRARNDEEVKRLLDTEF